MKKIERYNTSISKGLNSEQVEKRISQKLTNHTHIISKTYLSIILSNIFNFFNMIFFGLAAWLIFVGAYSDLVFMSVVLTNLAIGIYQQIRAKKSIDELSIMNAPTATVVRNGKEKSILSEEVVLDDIIILTAGKQIPADAVVLKGTIEVNESLLTGESDLIIKNPDTNIMAGSYVVSGRCYAHVIACGKRTYVSMLTKEGKTIRKPTSEILHALNILIRVIALIIIPLGIYSYLNNLNLGLSYFDTVVKTSASVIGIIPAGLYLMTSIALAVSSMRLAKRRALIQNLYSIEMLARVDVLCLDKTGTITDGTMRVENFITGKSKLRNQRVISSMLYHLNESDMTAQGLKNYFGTEDHYTPIIVVPFSSRRKYSAVSFRRVGTFILGAPEFILNIDDSLSEQIEEYTSRGKRVLALASTRATLTKSGFNGDTFPEALIVMDDNVRSDAHKTLEYFYQNDVEVKVISGDSVVTVSEIAQNAGVKDARNCISLDGKSDVEVIDAATRYTVFGRVVPDQKKLIIETLKSKNKKVAMTGDGVNDILALKSADVSIAMASGSEAARNVSQLVLMDSNFSSMPRVVKEGRRVINNIEKVASLFLMKTVYSLLLVLLTFIVSKPYPFRPIQMTLIELFVIGIPAFMLALESNRNKVTGKFIPKALRKALPGSIVVFLNVVVLYALQDTIGLSDFEVSIISAITTLVTGLIMLYIFCQPFNFYRQVLFLTMLFSSAICLIYLSDAFQVQINALSTSGILLMIVLVQASIPILLNLKKMKQTGENILKAGEMFLEKMDLIDDKEKDYDIAS
ncbi:HAD-IC family P-type ATPase [Mycoplasmatota bacterium zrk1]